MLIIYSMYGCIKGLILTWNCNYCIVKAAKQSKFDLKTAFSFRGVPEGIAQR